MGPLYGKEREVEDDEENDDTGSTQSNDDNKSRDHHHHNDDKRMSGTKMGHFTAEDASKLRKYLVLLQDCLAIKFVPCEDTKAHCMESSSGRLLQREVLTKRRFTMGEVDHTIHGLYLYKGFRESNLQCFWNAAVHESFKFIEYKGYIVPSTILISAFPRYLSTLRTAWSRKMLRSPPGYQIEFIGEIEDLIADPVQQSQFTPLSDSLCVAILELTSKGQEAFVDAILETLCISFPMKTLPSRELVYQTLEKLIRERKVYQTSHGYFVVTPDTYRFMTSGVIPSVDFGASLIQQSLPPRPESQARSRIQTNSNNNNDQPGSLTLDALVTSSEDKQPFVHQRNCPHYNGNANKVTVNSGEENNTEILQRHNSLNVVRRKDASNTKAESFAHRRFSLRFSKAKSCGNIEHDGKKETKVTKSSTMDHLSTAMRNLKTSERARLKSSVKNRKKNKSLFNKLFSFRRGKGNSNSRLVRSSISSQESYSETKSNMSSAGTQTSSKEILQSSLNGTMNTLPSSLTLPRQGGQPPPPHEFEYGLPSSDSWHERPGSRQTGSIGDDSPFYDSLLDHQAQVHHSETIPSGNANNSHFPSFHPGSSRGESSRCSTLSQATSSLGYGSQKGNHSSPCPSGNVSATYACVGEPIMKPKVQPKNSYYEYYKRRYPSYPSQFSRGSPQYSSLIESSSRHSKTMPRTSNHHVHYESVKSPTKPKATTSCEQLNGENNGDGTSTTTVTQNVKSTTNMELELLLPVKNIMKAALQAKKDQMKDKAKQEFLGTEPCKKSGSSNKVTVNVADTGATVKMGDPKTETQVTTTVDNNGVVETQYYETKGAKKGIQSRVEIHTNYPQDVQVVKLSSAATTVNSSDKKGATGVECA